MADLKEFVNRVLLPVQLSLGLFQIMKTTPLWAVIHCALASLLNFFHFPYTDYKQLDGFKGRVLKKVISHTTTAGTKVKKKDTEKNKKEGKSEDLEKSKKDLEESEELEKATKEEKSEELEKATKEEKSEDRLKTKKKEKSEDLLKTKKKANVKYLGKEFKLKRKHGNIMLMEDGPAYYITDKMWETVLHIEKVAKKSVFVKDHKEIWEEVVTGDIMEFKEVLDSVILDNRTVIRLDNDYFLPVNLLMSENKLTTTLNFVGLFLRTQNHIHWLIPALLTFASAIMGFSTKLRLWIHHLINAILCRSVQFLCDRLPLEMRRWVYSWGNWVENLKPSNDLKSKIVRGNTILLVAAGAKLDSECFADCESLDGKNSIHVLVGEDAKVDAESFADSESDVGDPDHISVLVSGGAKADLVIMADKSNIRTFRTGSTKARPDLSGDFKKFANRSEEWVHEIWPEVGPFLFECESVYIEWIFDNKQQICSLKAGRVASRESLKAPDTYIVCDDHGENYSGNTDAMPLRFCFPCGNDNKSVIADDLDTSSVDVECNSEEAIKLLKFASHMAKYKTTSLKSYDRKTKKVTVRRFVESINAYASSSYPPVYRLIMDDVVVR